MIPGVEMCNDKLQDLVAEIEDYKKSMHVAKKEIKASTLAFMAAHTTTLEVLGEAWKVQYKQRFHSKVSRDMKCMFCRMTFSVQNFRRNTLSVVIGQYLRILWVFLMHVANFCITM